MAPKDIKILIVEDFHSMRKLTQSMLKQLDFEQIDIAPDGREALEMLHAESYDIIISDLRIPGRLNGMDLLKAVRADIDLSALPDIFISDETKKEIIMQAVKEGISGYIVKPLSANTLKEKIYTALSGRSKEKPDAEPLPAET